MPATLDARWVSFFATGKAEYIYGIADYVADNAKIGDKQHQPEAGDDLLTFLAARWSLGSNMQQYPHIKALVEKYTAGWPSERQQALQRALNPPQLRTDNACSCLGCLPLAVIKDSHLHIWGFGQIISRC